MKIQLKTALVSLVLVSAGALGQEYADPENIDPYDVEEPAFACTQDCSGHEAGFEWARDNDITDPSQCGGRSQSFIEGCEGFAEQRIEQAEEAAEDADDE